MNISELLQKLAARTSVFTSKKFLAMVLGIVPLLIARYSPQNAEFAREILAVIGVYIIGQSGVDMVQNNAMGRAAAAYLAPVEPPAGFVVPDVNAPEGSGLDGTDEGDDNHAGGVQDDEA